MGSEIKRFDDVCTAWDIHRSNVDRIIGGDSRHIPMATALAEVRRRTRKYNVRIATACAIMLAASVAVQATAAEPSLTSGNVSVQHAVAVADNIISLS